MRFTYSFLSLVLLLAQHLSAQIKIDWAPREDLNILLPKSIRIYEGNGTLTDGGRVRMVYAVLNINDPLLTLLAKGSNEIRQTTWQAYQEHNGILAINGGYFSASQSMSLLVDNGRLISPDRNKNVTRGAFGLVDGKPEITWAHTNGNSLFKLSSPINPTLSKSWNEARWHPSQAVGGGPVLLKDGIVRVTDQAEGFGASHSIRHPRTAIGYKNDSTLIMMVVDGRQAASVGVSLQELATIMNSIGCYEAVNLDGGGSSAMIAANEVVNIPVDKPSGDRNSLRKNASALIITHNKSEVEKKLIVIDTDDADYTEEGVWKNTNHNNYYGDTKSRYSVANLSNKALYKFDRIASGYYQLAAWWTVDTSNAEARYILHHGNKVDTLRVLQHDLATSGKWNVLGNFILQPTDYIEVIGDGSENKLITDAIRLVAHEVYPQLPKRGDLRIAVISDLNSGLGAATYEWQVDSIINRLPRIWKPDLVLCGGDMVAGMGLKDSVVIKNIWEGFDTHILKPLQKNNIPFAFTIGNHDGAASYIQERAYTLKYWNSQRTLTGINFIDQQHFPFYYSFKQGDAFIVSIDASSSSLSKENMKWLEEQLKSSQAQQAKIRLAIGHIPLYSVAQERDSRGNVLDSPGDLQALFEKYTVRTYISGHHHAYFPGKNGALELLNAGAAGSGPRRWLNRDDAPVNTITLADVFFERDTIVYTTYKIKQDQPENMEVFDYTELPSSITGVNGTILRYDLPYVTKGTGTFLSIDENAIPSGHITVRISNDQVILEGAINSIQTIEGNTSRASLCVGKHTEAGSVLTTLQLKKSGKRGFTLSGQVPVTKNIRELLATGSLFVIIENNNKKLYRAQVYSEGNQAPHTSTITSHQPQNTYGVRNIEALYTIAWTPTFDLDGDFIDYTYQLARDSLFQEVIMQKNTGRQNYFKSKEKDWYTLLTHAEPAPQAFFHRVITSDGRYRSNGKYAQLNLTKSTELPDDYIEVEPPGYTVEKIENAAGAGSGAVWDKEGKIWLADYTGTLTIKTPAGKDALFSPLTAVTINGTNFSLKPINGIGLDLDGNILLGNNRILLKINATTGEGIAYWEAPKGARAITTPRSSSNGEVYAMSLFAEDPNYVLRQSTTTPYTFELLRTIDLNGRVLTRTFDMTKDARTLYFPDPGSAFVQVYESNDGTNYHKKENIVSLAAGCNAIHTQAGKSYFAVRSSGVTPTTLHFRDDNKREMWTLPLPELNGAEPRGITVSPDGLTVIICCWDKGGGFYRYTFSR